MYSYIFTFLPSVLADQSAAVPADGGAGEPKHPRHDIRQEEQDPSLLPLLAQVKNIQVRGGRQCMYTHGVLHDILYLL